MESFKSDCFKEEKGNSLPNYSGISNCSDDLFANLSSHNMNNTNPSGMKKSQGNGSSNMANFPVSDSFSRSNGHVSESFDSDSSMKTFSTPFIKSNKEKVSLNFNASVIPHSNHCVITSVADSDQSDMSILEDSMEDSEFMKTPGQVGIIFSAKKHLARSLLNNVTFTPSIKRQNNVLNKNCKDLPVLHDTEISKPKETEYNISTKISEKNVPHDTNKLSFISNKSNIINSEEGTNKNIRYNLRGIRRAGKENKHSNMQDFSQLLPKILDTPCTDKNNLTEQFVSLKRPAVLNSPSEIVTPLSRGLKMKKKKKNEENMSFGNNEDFTKIMDSIMTLKMSSDEESLREHVLTIRTKKGGKNPAINEHVAEDDTCNSDLFTPRRRLFFRNHKNNSLDDDSEKKEENQMSTNNVNLTPQIKSRLRGLGALLNNPDDFKSEKKTVQNKKTGKLVLNKESDVSSINDRFVSRKGNLPSKYPPLPQNEISENKMDDIESMPEQNSHSNENIDNSFSIDEHVCNNLNKDCGEKRKTSSSFKKSISYSSIQEKSLLTPEECDSFHSTAQPSKNSSFNNSNSKKSINNRSILNHSQQNNIQNSSNLNHSQKTVENSFQFAHKKNKKTNSVYFNESSDEEFNECSDNSQQETSNDCDSNFGKSEEGNLSKISKHDSSSSNNSFGSNKGSLQSKCLHLSQKKLSESDIHKSSNLNYSQNSNDNSFKFVQRKNKKDNRLYFNESSDEEFNACPDNSHLEIDRGVSNCSDSNFSEREESNLHKSGFSKHEKSDVSNDVEMDNSNMEVDLNGSAKEISRNCSFGSGLVASVDTLLNDIDTNVTHIETDSFIEKNSLQLCNKELPPSEEIITERNSSFRDSSQGLNREDSFAENNNSLDAGNEIHGPINNDNSFTKSSHVNELWKENKSHNSSCFDDGSLRDSKMSIDIGKVANSWNRSKENITFTPSVNTSVITLSDDDDDDSFSNIIKSKTPRKKNYLNCSGEKEMPDEIKFEDGKMPSQFPRPMKDKYCPDLLIHRDYDSSSSDVEIKEYGLNEVAELSSESSDEENRGKAPWSDLAAYLRKGTSAAALDNSFAVGKKRKVTDVVLPGYSSSSEHTSFLLSLSQDVPPNMCHPKAEKYKDSFSKHKDTLVDLLFKLYNQEIFDNALPLLQIKWSGRLTTTSGITKSTSRITPTGKIRTSGIKLSKTIVDSSWKLRDVLLHEMCHAANWLIDQRSDGHGPLFMYWAGKARLRFPEIPKVTVCHKYELRWKYIYRCTNCGYESGKMKLSLKEYSCGLCGGHIAVI